METLPEIDFSPLLMRFAQQGIITGTFYRLDALRQTSVISAILQESSQSGPAALNIKKVAARAGVSIGSLYQYFRNRDGLLQFAIALTVEETVRTFQQFIPYLDHLTFDEAFKIYLSAGMEWGQQQQQIVRFFATAAYQNNPQLHQSVVDPIAECMLDLMRKMIQKGLDHAEIRSDLDPESLARLLHAISIAVADPVLLPHLNHYFKIFAGDADYEKVLQTLLQVLKHGLKHSTSPEENA